MTAQTVSSCVVCGAVTDRFLCGSERHGSGCLGELLRQLGDCAALVDELNTTLSRQDNVTPGGAGFVTGTATRSLPYAAGASEAGGRLRDILCSWARALWEDNSVPEEDGSVPLIDLAPAITPVSRWLMRHPSWMSLHPAADELYNEIVPAIEAAKRSVDIPRDNRQFLGKCGFEIEGVKCKEELYSRSRQDEVTCSVCGTWWIVEERQDWLLATVENEVASAAVLSGLLTSLGVAVGEADIRKMAKRGEIAAVSVDVHKRRSYRVGDVMNAFMGDRAQPLSA